MTTSSRSPFQVLTDQGVRPGQLLRFWWRPADEVRREDPANILLEVKDLGADGEISSRLYAMVPTGNLGNWTPELRDLCTISFERYLGLREQNRISVYG